MLIVASFSTQQIGSLEPDAILDELRKLGMDTRQFEKLKYYDSEALNRLRNGLEKLLKAYILASQMRRLRYAIDTSISIAR